ncbi:zinc ribbon domain-containing protein [Celeribacter baekdonensis]|uniref:zinc ribbon domain-containing protein n=1 Tax=Celeribacter baekdonensis TaxID=875171 RepID=UPI00131F2CBE|nr:zinc ribbon domain-containing protein [Celeribacter baekdonensis]
MIIATSSSSSLGALAIALLNHGVLGWSTTALVSIVGFCLALGYWIGTAVKSLGEVPTTFGSARWATADDLAEYKLWGKSGIYLGEAYDGETMKTITYKGDRHLVVSAPSRTHKGTSLIIPNLLSYQGSTVVIDPKGENALITAQARQEMGQQVCILDPWGIAPVEGITPVRFNPLDWLQEGDTGHICSETYGINWLKAQHEPLITLALFNKVQERRQGVAKAPKRPDIGETFVMRGMVICACCGASLRSSITRGNGGHYPYYLCQTKGCEAYGKSIPRDKLEADVGNLIKTLQPTDTLMMLATAMFRDAWNARRDQAQDILNAAKRRITTIDKEIATLLDRIMAASNHIVIQSYETKIGELEQQKALMAETLHSQPQKPDSFEDKLEPVLTFLANPWKLWETGHIHARRLVAKLAFADRVAYDRKLGARTPEIALPFKALGDVYTLHEKSGAGGGT